MSGGGGAAAAGSAADRFGGNAGDDLDARAAFNHALYIEDKPLEYNDAWRAWARACEGVVAEMYEDAVNDLAGESSDDNAFLDQFLEKDAEFVELVHAMAEALGAALSESHLDALAQATRETALELGIDMTAGAEDFQLFPTGTTCEEDQKGTLEATAFSQFLRDGAVSGHAAAILTQVVEGVLDAHLACTAEAQEAIEGLAVGAHPLAKHVCPSGRRCVQSNLESGTDLGQTMLDAYDAIKPLKAVAEPASYDGAGGSGDFPPKGKTTHILPITAKKASTSKRKGYGGGPSRKQQTKQEAKRRLFDRRVEGAEAIGDEACVKCTGAVLQCSSTPLYRGANGNSSSFEAAGRYCRFEEEQLPPAADAVSAMYGKAFLSNRHQLGAAMTNLREEYATMETKAAQDELLLLRLWDGPSAQPTPSSNSYWIAALGLTESRLGKRRKAASSIAANRSSASQHGNTGKRAANRVSESYEQSVKQYVARVRSRRDCAAAR